MKKKLMVAAVVCIMALPSAPAQADHRGSARNFLIGASADGTRARFPYLASLTTSGIASGWVAGDRVAYRCAYMFLRSRGRLVGRVTFTRIEYTTINDKYMKEGVRYYDGTVATGGANQLNDCPPPTEPYAPADGPIGPLPQIFFTDVLSGRTLEVRNYANVEQRGTGAPFEFQIVSATPDRVTVLAYQSGMPIFAVYYDRLSTDITVSSNA